MITKRGLGSSTILNHTLILKVFVHCHQILTENRTLSTGDQVEYKVEKGPKGFVATAVVQMGACSDAAQILARLANGEDVSAMSDQQELRRRKGTQSDFNGHTTCRSHSRR